MEPWNYNFSGSGKSNRNNREFAAGTEEQLTEELLTIKELAHCIEALSEMAISGDQSGCASLTIAHLAKKIEQAVDICHNLQTKSDEINGTDDWLRSFMKKSKKSGFFPE